VADYRRGGSVISYLSCLGKKIEENVLMWKAIGAHGVQELKQSANGTATGVGKQRALLPGMPMSSRMSSQTGSERILARLNPKSVWST
jgi:hypothetical protein